MHDTLELLRFLSAVSTPLKIMIAVCVLMLGGAFVVLLFVGMIKYFTGYGRD